MHWKKELSIRNYRHGRYASVFSRDATSRPFSLETQNMIALLQKTADIGMVFDCCGKPIAELGMEKEEKLIIDRWRNRFKDWD